MERNRLRCSKFFKRLRSRYPPSPSQEKILYAGEVDISTPSLVHGRSIEISKTLSMAPPSAFRANFAKASQCIHSLTFSPLARMKPMGPYPFCSSERYKIRDGPPGSV